MLTEAQFQRNAQLSRHRQRPSDQPWDMAVIGGGATGIGIALDAASRGYSVCLLEQSDFGKGTSSRSTKLVHGGVRYLKQGNVALVRDALIERRRLLENAPHVVRDLAFVIPCESLWQIFFYAAGLKLYDFLAGRRNLAKSHWLSQSAAYERLTTLDPNICKGGVLYHDGQFDDSRLLIDMARTASAHGACLLNYAQATGLLKDSQGAIEGVNWVDLETQEEFSSTARIVINATGPFCDSVRRLDEAQAAPIVAASQGIHLVLPRRLFPGETALIVPKTSDGRVVFLIPWHGHVVLGTTDTPIESPDVEPTAMPQEIDFLLETAGRYLKPKPTRADVLSVFTGIRPLVMAASATKAGAPSRTSQLSRDHTILRSKQGLVTITGGKWTTYRKMAEDCVDRAAQWAGLPVKACRTSNLPILAPTSLPQSPAGNEQPATSGCQYLGENLSITEADIRRSVDEEMARTVEDVLARRTRGLFLNARRAVADAPMVARQMAALLGRDQAWVDTQLDHFAQTADHFLPPAA